MFIVEDSIITKFNGYFLTSSLKYQYLVKARPFSPAKSIVMYDYLKPTQRDFKPETFFLHVTSNDTPLNKPPKKNF